MKKLILAGAAFMAIAFASCKKDYTCVCTTVYNVGTSTQYTKEETVATYKATRKSADDSCEKNNTENRTCDIK